MVLSAGGGLLAPRCYRSLQDRPGVLVRLRADFPAGLLGKLCAGPMLVADVSPGGFVFRDRARLWVPDWIA